MIESPIRQALDIWRRSHLSAQLETWTLNLAAKVNPSRHNASPLTLPLGSYIRALTVLYLTSRHLDAPSFTSKRSTLYTPSFSLGLGSYFNTLLAASDRVKNTWRGMNSLSMSPWEYYPLNLGNASSTMISRGNNSSSCGH
jgi:hypothetical protein